MPIYSYKCACGVQFERLFLSMSSASEFYSCSECPECKDDASRIVDSAPQVFFKGGGWNSRGGAKYSNPFDATKNNKIDPKDKDAFHRE